MRKDLARRDFSDSYVLYNVSTLVSAYPYVSKFHTRKFRIWKNGSVGLGLYSFNLNFQTFEVLQ